MKKILCLVLLLGFAYPQTGNDFLRDYPFGKEDVTANEMIAYTKFNFLAKGILDGNFQTLTSLGQEVDWYDFIYYRICKMDGKQRIRIIKKWCDDNPDKTHLSFSEVVYLALSELPLNNPDDCE